jgi:hypothetical protein
MNTKEKPRQKTSKILDPKENIKALVRIITIVAILLGGIWLFVRFTAGEKVANNVASTVLRQRIELVNTIVDLPVSSFRTIGLSLPYTGTLSIDLTVKKGNDISVFLVTPDQIEKIKAGQNFQYIQGFDAEKTKSYLRSGRVASGTYHLVLLDKTLGILSQSSSDVQVVAKLEP